MNERKFSCLCIPTSLSMAVPQEITNTLAGFPLRTLAPGWSLLPLGRKGLRHAPTLHFFRLLLERDLAAPVHAMTAIATASLQLNLREALAVSEVHGNRVNGALRDHGFPQLRKAAVPADMSEHLNLTHPILGLGFDRHPLASVGSFQPSRIVNIAAALRGHSEWQPGGSVLPR